jgi:ATP-dependent Lhr-like helicase
VYRVLKELEERGRVRRGYFIEGLGGSQFAVPGAVDMLRADFTDRTRIFQEPEGGTNNATGEPFEVEKRNPAGSQRPSVELARSALLLAATDPANPYGAALPWPTNPDRAQRPGRKAGAVVVLVNGDLVRNFNESVLDDRHFTISDLSLHFPQISRTLLYDIVSSG